MYKEELKKRNGENCSDAVELMTIVRSRSSPSRAGMNFSDVVQWSEAKFLVPDSGIELLYRPARLYSLAGLYIVQQPYARVNYIP
jgi:hypothetical protein